MNTTTMRLEHYLHDDEGHANEIATYVRSVLAKEDCIPSVSAWLRQRFEGTYDHLDWQYVEWESLARRFVLAIAPIADENLPRLVVALVNAAHWLEEECSEQMRVAGTAAGHAASAIAAWKQQWQDSLPISFPEFLHRCRQAPPSFVLDGLLTLYDALMESARMAGDVGFWNEGGDGEEAQRIGERAIQNTWWAFHSLLRKWADDRKFAIRAVLDQAYDALMQEAARRETFGVIEPEAAALRDLRAYVFGGRYTQVP